MKGRLKTIIAIAVAAVVLVGCILFFVFGLVVDSVAYKDTDLTVREDLEERLFHYEFFHFLPPLMIIFKHLRRGLIKQKRPYLHLLRPNDTDLR